MFVTTLNQLMNKINNGCMWNPLTSMNTGINEHDWSTSVNTTATLTRYDQRTQKLSLKRESYYLCWANITMKSTQMCQIVVDLKCGPEMVEIRNETGTSRLNVFVFPVLGINATFFLKDSILYWRFFIRAWLAIGKKIECVRFNVVNCQFMVNSSWLQEADKRILRVWCDHNAQRPATGRQWVPKINIFVVLPKL